jgi:hypothetical protein
MLPRSLVCAAPLVILLAGALATTACDDGDSDPADGSAANLGAAGATGTAGSGGGGAGVSGPSGASGSADETCLCSFQNGTHGIDLARGCRLRLRDEPEVLVCSHDETQCGGITIGCDLVAVTDGVLEHQKLASCPNPAGVPDGWRAPTNEELALLASAPECPGEGQE